MLPLLVSKCTNCGGGLKVIIRPALPGVPQRTRRNPHPVRRSGNARRLGGSPTQSRKDGAKILTLPLAIGTLSSSHGLSNRPETRAKRESGAPSGKAGAAPATVSGEPIVHLVSLEPAGSGKAGRRRRPASQETCRDWNETSSGGVSRWIAWVVATTARAVDAILASARPLPPIMGFEAGVFVRGNRTPSTRSGPRTRICGPAPSRTSSGRC